MRKSKEKKPNHGSKILPIAGVITSLAGIIAVFVIRQTFMMSVKDAVLSDGFAPIAKENFELYFKLSLIMCTVLFVLCLLSGVTNFILKDSAGRFSALSVKTAPILSALAMVVLSAFYAYLTYDNEFPIAHYLILLGISEGAVLLLPPSLYRICCASANKPTNTSGRN